MKNEKDYSVEDIIDITIRNLNSISVPVALHEQIGTPIIQSINNLIIAKQKLEIVPEPKEDEILDLGDITAAVNEDIKDDQ